MVMGREGGTGWSWEGRLTFVHLGGIWLVEKFVVCSHNLKEKANKVIVEKEERGLTRKVASWIVSKVDLGSAWGLGLRLCLGQDSVLDSTHKCTAIVPTHIHDVSRSPGRDRPHHRRPPCLASWPLYGPGDTRPTLLSWASGVVEISIHDSVSYNSREGAPGWAPNSDVA